MISYIRGELAFIEEEKAVIDVQGVGYGVFMPASALSALPKAGSEVRIHTYMNVKEDCLQLFGFLTRDDLQIFKQVISVNGIGPKGGLAILSNLAPDDLRFAVISNDIKAISAAPGIGKKTAEKLILELRDKISFETAAEAGGEGAFSGISIQNNDVQSEAIQALSALGYGNTEALKAVKQVTILEEMTVEDILKQALKNMVF